RALWEAHRRRTAEAIKKLEVKSPSPRVDRWDPWAMRIALVMGTVLMVGFAGDRAADRIASAFRLGPIGKKVDSRLDAWVTPPSYTGRAPIILADGNRPASEQARSQDKIEVPARSVLVVRGTDSLGALSLEIQEAGGGPVRRIDAKVMAEILAKEAQEQAQREAAEALRRQRTERARDTKDGGNAGTRRSDAPAAAQPTVQPAAATPPGASSQPAPTAAVPDPNAVTELKFTLLKTASVRVLAGRREVVTYKFEVTPDALPTVTFARPPERTLRGALRVPYKASDDYGVASVEVRFAPIGKPKTPDRNAWAREEVQLKGPRLPRERPPAMNIRLPRAYAKTVEGIGLTEINDHLWGGLPVRVTLVARDVAGQMGRSETLELILPQRQFRKPLARALIEQRRLLVSDSRHAPRVQRTLQTLTWEPERYVPDRSVYLSLRTMYHRLERDKSRASLVSVAQQLWHTAVRVEDGGLSKAQADLRAAQDRLQEALENGASEEEIARLMQELREALNQFLDEMRQNAQPGQQQQPNNQNRPYSQRDLEQMLRNLENQARRGDRDQARDMLSQLRDLLDRLQNGQMAQQQGQGGEGDGNPMGEMMNELGELLGQQQQLLDDTFRQQRGQQPGQGQQGQGQGQQRQPGQRGQGQQPGQPGQPGQGQEPGGDQPGGPGGSLAERQQQLRDRLGRLQEQLRQQGLQGQFGDAENAMREAERRLRDNDLNSGADNEARALEQLRQGARDLAQQMMQRMQQAERGEGPGGDTPPELDPLGRPNGRTDDGGDVGSQLALPEQYDTERAREILEELRRRSGDRGRPTIELDYLERLLRRF
ncbi:MAG: hypothetical protein RL291_1872, partial [Pseudomonadota bacterium]